MIQLYKCGREDGYGWRGICEYDHENWKYRHRDNTLGIERAGDWKPMRPERLATHLANRWWVPFQPELQLPEGL